MSDEPATPRLGINWLLRAAVIGAMFQLGLAGCGDQRRQAERDFEAALADLPPDGDDAMNARSLPAADAPVGDGRPTGREEQIADSGDGDSILTEPANGKPRPPERETQPPRDWPVWMGPDYEGVSDETGWSLSWPKDGLPIRWKQKIGIGFSSVSISKGRLFTMGHRGGFDSVFCFDADSGEPIWQVENAAPLVDNLYEGGPGCTPTVDGDRVYTVSKGGLVQCLSVADGERIWKVELQTDLDVALPEWGFNGSPYLLKDLLILEAGRVVAYDKLTGKKRWQTDKHTAGYGSAASLEHQGRTLIVTLDCEGLRVVAAKDGEQVAFFPWTSPFRTNATTPKIIDGKIFISTAYNVGCGLFELKDGELQLLYSNRDMRNHFNNSILWEGNLYGFDGNSNLGRIVHLTCMDAKTGKLQWRQRGLGCGSLMIVDGKLLILSEGGELVVADATPKEYRELARSPILQGRCWTAPLLLNGKVYARNATGDLVCIDLPTDE